MHLFKTILKLNTVWSITENEERNSTFMQVASGWQRKRNHIYSSQLSQTTFKAQLLRLLALDLLNSKTSLFLSSFIFNIRILVAPVGLLWGSNNWGTHWVWCLVHSKIPNDRCHCVSWYYCIIWLFSFRLRTKAESMETTTGGFFSTEMCTYLFFPSNACTWEAGLPSLLLSGPGAAKTWAALWKVTERRLNNAKWAFMLGIRKEPHFPSKDRQKGLQDHMLLSTR